MLDLALDNRVFLYDKLDCAIQELDILFGTENTELINNPYFGTNFEQFLWQLNPSPNELKKYIIEKIQYYTYFLTNIEYELNVEVIQGEIRNIYVVNIDLEDKEEKKSKTYQFR